MIINPTFSFAPGTTQADMSEFESAVNAVISQYEQLFTNNVTLNIDYAYGEAFGGISSNQIVFQPMPVGSLGVNEEGYYSFDYSTVVAALTQNEQSTVQTNAYATLPAIPAFWLVGVER